MARKSKHITIEGDAATNRDVGKVYLLTEMAASPTEKWAARAFLALSNANIEVPEGISSLGYVGVWLIGYRAFQQAKWADIEPLMDEMMECVRVCPNVNDRGVSRPLIETDIEEVSTRAMLRKEIMELHAGFTFADLQLMLQLKSAMAATTSAPETSPDLSKPS